jgi:hypothetical protein
MRMLDLFSGLHGASQAFKNDPKWEVVSIDNNPDLNPTYCWDLEEVGAVKKIVELGYFDLIWASPPCVEFYKVRAPFFPDEYGNKPSMKLVEIVLEVVSILQPDFWVLENTKSGSEFIKPILGDPRRVIGPFYLWGNFIRFDADISTRHKAKNDVWSSNPLRSNIRAKIPKEISAALHDTIMNQKTLENWQ